MRTTYFLKNEIYEIYSFGSNKKAIFLDKEDYSRFLFYLLYFKSPTRLNNSDWYTNRFIKKGDFGINKETELYISSNKISSLISFVILNNKFKLIVQALEDTSISVYMHRVLTGYSKYHNLKYKTKGHTFDGPFYSKHINSIDKLRNTSKEIHTCFGEIENPLSYTWSSYQDTVLENRWPNLLDTKIILDQFKDKREYIDFLKSN